LESDISTTIRACCGRRPTISRLSRTMSNRRMATCHASASPGAPPTRGDRAGSRAASVYRVDPVIERKQFTGAFCVSHASFQGRGRRGNKWDEVA
jgi:hypothetical protein